MVRSTTNFWRFCIATMLLTASSVVSAQDPACQDEPFRAFDFWLGSWSVADGEGNVVGRNAITKGERGCVLAESWESSTGGTGRSLNFYDPVTDRWRQVWVSPGSIIDIEGGLDDEGSMVLTGTITYTGNATSQPFRGRWTLLEDGRVRQFFEQRPATGGDWSAWFEGFYRKVPY